jgi:predicted PurR-regulated permease PerM
MNGSRAAWFWLGALAFLLLALYLLSAILLPFVAGAAIAYLLDPVVDRLARWRIAGRVLPRSAAAALVLALFIVALAVILLLILPLLQLEAVELARRTPAAVEFARQQIQALMDLAQQKLSPDEVAKIKEMAGGWAGAVVGWVARLVQSLLTSGLALANLLSLIFVTPIVAFLLLRDWKAFLAQIDALLPRRHAATIREQARLVDATLAGFVHGQSLVGICLAVYYAVALSVAGVPSAIILAVLVGILSFLPYVGDFVAFALALGLAALQGPSWSTVVWVLAIFGVGQIIDSNFLAPRLVGARVHLHPVWLLFALLAFGALFGITGVLVALPTAAAIGVLARFGAERYHASALYDPDRRSGAP